MHCETYALKHHLLSLSSQCESCAKYQQGELEPNYPMPAIKYSVLNDGYRVVIWNDTHWTKSPHYLALMIDGVLC